MPTTRLNNKRMASESPSSSSNSSKGYFTVVGSKILTANGKYLVSVNCHAYEKEEELQIGIVAKKDDEMDAYKNFKNVKLMGSKSQVIEFDMKDAENSSNFRLEVKKDEGFKDSESLTVNSKKYSIICQTDKSVYKPEDLVQFRILAIDGETKPLDNLSNVEIFITDGAGNRVKQFDGVKFNKGVYQNELQLSDMPVMGNWKIHVKVDNDETVKTFGVDEYVLPKFEVSITTDNDVCFKDGKVRATVKAKYTFGKLAKGKATVMAKVENYHHERWGGRQSLEGRLKAVSKTVEVDGKNFVEFDFKNDLRITDHSRECSITLTATYKDDLSGKDGQATAIIQIHTARHKIELKTSSEKFKPELPFVVTAFVKAHDKNAPITDDRNPVVFTITSYYDILRRIKANSNEIVAGRKMRAGEDYECWEENFSTKQVKVFPVNGIAKLDVEIAKNTKNFHVKAKYLLIEEQVQRIEKEDSESNQYIAAKLLTEKPNLNEKFAIEVSATEELTELCYQVFGRGKLVESKTIKVDNSKKCSIEIQPCLLMIPKANVVVYYFTSNGEIISDKIEIEFGHELINYVDLKLSKEQAKPGENLELSVTTKPNSFVGLLGIDQSVLLLKKGNDIESSAVFEELDKYAEGDFNSYDSSSRYRRGFNGNDFQNFENSNAIIITNAKKKYNKEVFKKMRSMRGGGPAQGMLFGMQDQMMFASSASSMEFDSMEMNDCTFENIETSAPSKKPIQIRTEFPETWIFDNLQFDANSTTKVLSKKVPDTITSWIITGFSIDPLTGLGLTKQATKLNVFQPFFVTTNLPYSIKRGEVVAVPLIVFNYLENDQNARVTLFNKDHEFEFVEVADDDDNKSRPKRALESERSKTVEIKSNEGATVSFMIRPLKVGQITIKVIAESDQAGDGLEKLLRVEPEGVTQYMNEAVFIDLRKDDKFSKKINIIVPENAVPDSTKVEASAIGDILGPSIDNLDKLIQMPYGCGEQNMLNFVPNIVVLGYLTNVKRLTPAIEAKSKKYMEVGYQRELTYKHKDGSYSAFGKSDKSGSTWLTAFVAKSFNQASKYIDIDQNIISTALDFLKKTQASDGSFPEVGEIYHRDMQGGSSKGIALTAYTLITFLENKQFVEKYENVITKAVDYIIKNCEELNDTYSLAIASYALQLSDNKCKESFVKRLDAKSENKDGMKYWQKDVPAATEESNHWHHRPNSVNVEMSAYAMQAFIEASRDGEAVPIMKWLVTQRNENGGFQSTQDTVVGLQALSKLATKIYVPNNEIQVTVKSNKKQVAAMSLNAGNALILQKHELPSDARSFDVEANGKGFSILQISYKYNLDNSGKFPRFILTPTVEATSNKEFLNLTVITKFVADAEVDKSNMAVMEISLPSGFTFDSDILKKLLTSKVKKVETKDDETVVMLYFNDVTIADLCIKIKAYRTHGVAKLKPAPIIIYDYYDNSRCARTFYNPPEISLVDISG